MNKPGGHGAPRRQRANPFDVLWSRGSVRLAVVLIGTGLLLYCCYLMARPFLPALAWALALAIVSYPIHDWVARRIRHRSVAAGFSVLIVAILLLAPASFVVPTVLKEVTDGVEQLQSGKLEAKLGSALQSSPRLSPWWNWIGDRIHAKESASQLTAALGKWTGKIIGSTIAGTASLLIAFFLLFYFLRDRTTLMNFVRSLLPLSAHETAQLLQRVRDTVFATVFGTLSVALVQGTLGGLMFWWLGLPAPLLWGVLMSLLAIIPVLGAFVVWIPAAISLALQGFWGKAWILTLWGMIVIGLIDNLLYPILVGSRLRLHTVPVFIAIVGGLFVFGGSGVILGPVILALTDGVLDLWHRQPVPGARQSSIEPSV